MENEYNFVENSRHCRVIPARSAEGNLGYPCFFMPEKKPSQKYKAPLRSLNFGPNIKPRVIKLAGMVMLNSGRKHRNGVGPFFFGRWVAFIWTLLSRNRGLGWWEELRQAKEAITSTLDQRFPRTTPVWAVHTPLWPHWRRGPAGRTPHPTPRPAASSPSAGWQWTSTCSWIHPSNTAAPSADPSAADPSAASTVPTATAPRFVVNFGEVPVPRRCVDILVSNGRVSTPFAQGPFCGLTTRLVGPRSKSLPSVRSPLHPNSSL